MSNILLVNDNVQDYQTIINACRDDTYAITYNEKSDTYDSIFAKYENIVLENNIQLVNHLGLVSHGSNNPEFTFLEKENKMLISQYLPDISNCASLKKNKTDDNDLSLNNIDTLFDNTNVDVSLDNVDVSLDNVDVSLDDNIYPDISKYIIDLSLNLTQEEFNTKEIYTIADIGYIFKDASCNILGIIYDNELDLSLSYCTPTIDYLIMESYDYKIRDTSENYTLTDTETDNYESGVLDVLTEEAISITTDNPEIKSNYSPTDIEDVSSKSSTNRYNILNNLDSWNAFKEFIKKFNIQNSLDFLGCALLQSNNWRYTLNMLETPHHLNLNIRASDDNTGNLKVGGNWILESDNVNIKELYFDGESIERWKYILPDNVAISSIKIKYNNINAPLSLGETKLSNLAGVEYEIIESSGPYTPYQTQYTTPGTFNWTCPANIYSVCVVCCGGGGGGMYYTNNYPRTYPMQAGGGGGLGWKNNIPVTPGNSYEVKVGLGGAHGAYNNGSKSGGESYFISKTIVGGGGGAPGKYYRAVLGGTFVGDGGGNGGGVFLVTTGGPSGGGGAGGYTGNGGTGSNPTSNPGSGGGGASGRGSYGSGNLNNGSTTKQSTGGGGVGFLGEGPSGSSEGAGGSGGANANTVYLTSDGRLGDQKGGLFGGGGGGSASRWKLVDPPGEAGDGGGGFVRIIGGVNRSYPNTNTGDITEEYYQDKTVGQVIPSTNITFSTLNYLNTNTIINMKPTMTITAVGGTSGTPLSNDRSSIDDFINLTLTSSEPTSDFVSNGIYVASSRGASPSGSISNFAQTSSTIYTATFTPTSLIDGETHNIAVNQGAYTNNKTTIGCQNIASPTFNWGYSLANTYNEMLSLNSSLSSYNYNDVVSIRSTFATEGYTLISTPTYNAMAERMGSQNPITTIGKFYSNQFNSSAYIEPSTGFPSGGVNGWPGMLFACFVGTIYKGIAYQSYTDGHTAFGDYPNGRGDKRLKDFFSPNENRPCHLYVINADGTEVKGTGSTIYSDNQSPNSNGYNSTSRFANDDGAWGMVIDLERLDGNGGPYMRDYSSKAYGCENPNSGDQAANNAYWGGANPSTTYSFYFCIKLAE